MMYRSSRVITFSFLTDCAIPTWRTQIVLHQHGVFIQNSINLGERFLQTDKARMKNQMDLNLCEAVHICLREPLTLRKMTQY